PQLLRLELRRMVSEQRQSLGFVAREMEPRRPGEDEAGLPGDPGRRALALGEAVAGLVRSIPPQRVPRPLEMGGRDQRALRIAAEPVLPLLCRLRVLAACFEGLDGGEGAVVGEGPLAGGAGRFPELLGGALELAAVPVDAGREETRGGSLIVIHRASQHLRNGCLEALERREALPLRPKAARFVCISDLLPWCGGLGGCLGLPARGRGRRPRDGQEGHEGDETPPAAIHLGIRRGHFVSSTGTTTSGPVDLMTTLRVGASRCRSAASRTVIR